MCAIHFSILASSVIFLPCYYPRITLLDKILFPFLMFIVFLWSLLVWIPISGVQHMLLRAGWAYDIWIDIWRRSKSMLGSIHYIRQETNPLKSLLSGDKEWLEKMIKVMMPTCCDQYMDINAWHLPALTKTSTKTIRPWNAALYNGVQPLRSVLLTAAPLCSKIC